MLTAEYTSYKTETRDGDSSGCLVHVCKEASSLEELVDYGTRQGFLYFQILKIDSIAQGRLQDLPRHFLGVDQVLEAREVTQKYADALNSMERQILQHLTPAHRLAAFHVPSGPPLFHILQPKDTAYDTQGGKIWPAIATPKPPKPKI